MANHDTPPVAFEEDNMAGYPNMPQEDADATMNMLWRMGLSTEDLARLRAESSDGLNMRDEILLIFTRNRPGPVACPVNGGDGLFTEDGHAPEGK